MRSEVAKRILSETPDEVREFVKSETNKLVMEKPKIEIMNSVIACYDGYKPAQNNCYSKEIGGFTHVEHIASLRYDLNMNLLYPVWQKVVNIHITGGEWHKIILGIYHLFACAAPISELHEAIYNAVVWLNTNNKPSSEQVTG